MSAESARVFLIDDHPAVRQGLALLLAQENHTIAGEAGSMEEARRLLSSCQVDVALLDLLLGEESGLDLIEELRLAGIPVLVYSMYEDASTIRRVFAHGANGYVCKREVSDALLQAVSEVLCGNSHLSPLAAHSLASAPAGTACDAVALSERELQILALIAQGCGNQEIADQLALSVRTVESYCARAIEKLCLDGMKALRRYAIQNHR